VAFCFGLMGAQGANTALLIGSVAAALAAISSFSRLKYQAIRHAVTSEKETLKS